MIFNDRHMNVGEKKKKKQKRKEEGGGGGGEKTKKGVEGEREEGEDGGECYQIAVSSEFAEFAAPE